MNGPPHVASSPNEPRDYVRVVARWSLILACWLIIGVSSAAFARRSNPVLLIPAFAVFAHFVWLAGGPVSVGRWASMMAALLERRRS